MTQPVPPRPTSSRPGSRPNSHRAPGPAQLPRLRKGRLALLGAAVITTGVTFLGGFGMLPSSAKDDTVAATAYDPQGAPSTDDVTKDSTKDSTKVQGDVPTTDASPTSTPTDSPTTPSVPTGTASTPTVTTDDVAVPADSGSGRRAVFSQSEQRVWIVLGDGTVKRTYLVSGSVTHNLDPGTYEVYSRSIHAIGVDDSGTMTHFVRFTQGPSGAAIGFHDIPVKDGKHIQTRGQLGTPRSHGCIRAAEPDAKAMWKFAQMGTKVVVTA